LNPDSSLDLRVDRGATVPVTETPVPREIVANPPPCATLPESARRSAAPDRRIEPVRPWPRGMGALDPLGESDSASDCRIEFGSPVEAES